MAVRAGDPTVVRSPAPLEIHGLPGRLRFAEARIIAGVAKRSINLRALRKLMLRHQAIR